MYYYEKIHTKNKNCEYPIKIFIFACCSLLPEDSDGEEIENTNKCVLVWEVS